MRKFNRFQAGSGCFKCVICERNTRDTGQGVDHLCEDCYEIAGIDNHYNDNGSDANEAYRVEANNRLAHIKKLGGNIQRVVDSNEYVWPNGMPAEFSETTVAPQPEMGEVKSTEEITESTNQPEEKKMSKKSRAMSKAQKTVNLVAKFDGKITPGELVAKIQSTCKFNTERAARTYLHNARKAIKAGKATVTAARKRSKKAVAKTEDSAEAA